MNSILQTVQEYESQILTKGEFPYKISSLILNSKTISFDWELFAKVFQIEKDLGKNSFFHSAHIASELMRPKIKTSLNKFFNGEYEINPKDEENLSMNILISFNEALKSYDEKKGKFPVLCENYIKEALRVTFQADSTYYGRNKDKEKAISKGVSKEFVDEYVSTLHTPVFWDDIKTSHKNKDGDSESVKNIIPAKTTVEEDYEDMELSNTIKTMFNFFRLCGVGEDNKVDLLVAFNLWTTFVPLFKENELLFDKFKSEINMSAKKFIKKESITIEREMEVE